MYEITSIEVEVEIMEIPKSKAFELGWFTTKFFQSCWNDIGMEVLEFVYESRRTTFILPTFNVTFLMISIKWENVYEFWDLDLYLSTM